MIADLLRIPAFRRLVAGLAVSMLAESVLLLALGIWVKSLTGSDASAGAVILAIALPSLFAPALGTWIDRVPRKRFLVWLNVASAVALLPLFAVVDADQLALIYVVAFLYGLALPLTAAATGGLLKDLVSTEELGDANGVLQTIRQGLRLIGPLVGAGLLVVLGPRVFITVVIAGFLIAAAAIGRVSVQESTAAPSEESWIGQMLEGWRALRHNVRLLAVTLTLSVATLAMGLLEPVVFAVTDTGLARPPEFVSVIVFTQGIGSVIGGLTAGRMLRLLGETRAVALALLVTAPAVALWIAPWTPTVLLGAALMGLAFPWALVGFSTLLQRTTRSSMIGRVTTTSEALLVAPQVVGIAAGGYVLANAQFGPVVAVAAALVAAAGVGLLVVRRVTGGAGP